MTTLAARIRQARTANAYNQREFAELIGAKAVTVRCWESGKRNPRPQFIRTMARKLRLPVRYFTAS